MRNFVDYFIKYTERVKDINDAAINAPAELVAQMESQYRKRINEIADFLNSNGKQGNKLIMLAGPSSSGKTTTACMLCERLEELGVHSRRISLDEFFKNSLREGLDYHITHTRGRLPAGLVEEIRALSMPFVGKTSNAQGDIYI